MVRPGKITMDGRVRTFIALTVPDDIRLRLSRIATAINAPPHSVRPVSLDQLHLTLAFIGETSHTEIAGISLDLRDIAAERPDLALSISGIGAFPSVENPRVLVAHSEPNDDLSELKSAIDEALYNGYKIPQEKRGFRPHITLARGKGAIGRDRFSAWFDHYAGWTTDPFLCDEIAFYQSDLTRTGPEYSILSTAILGGPGLLD